MFDKENIISWNIHCVPFSLSFPPGTSMIHILVSLIVSHVSLKLCSYFFVTFPFPPHSWWFQFSHLQIYWYFLLPGEICCWTLLVCFLFSHCTCHLQNLFFFFYWIVYMSLLIFSLFLLQFLIFWKSLSMFFYLLWSIF